VTAAGGGQKRKHGGDADAVLELQRSTEIAAAGADPEDVTLTTAAIEAAVKTAKLHAARKKYSMVSTERWDEGPISDGNTYDISYDIASSQEALAALGA
jgi:hypothetical protein